jgi:hypothetical protein
MPWDIETTSPRDSSAADLWACSVLGPTDCGSMVLAYCRPKERKDRGAMGVWHQTMTGPCDYRTVSP